MKKLLFLLVAGNFCFAQNVVFGDNNFKLSLIKTYPSLDANKDNEISVEEAKTLTSIRSLSLYNYTKIKSIDGIEAFTNITELDVKQNQIKTVDLSQNTKIKSLNMRENLLEGELDISMLTLATTVELNTNQLTSLKIPASGKIQFLYVNDNLLTSIDLSGQPDLKRPYFVRNNITTIDFSHNPNIDRINMDGNALTAVDLSGLTKLTWASFVENNLSQMTFQNNPLLKSLLLQKNNLTTLNFQDGLPNTLTLINLTDNSSFQKIVKDSTDTISGVTPTTVVIENGSPLSAASFSRDEVKVFPNPFAEQLSFSQAVSNVVIYDLAGRKIFAEAASNKSIMLNFLKPGQYLIRYELNGAKFSKMITKK
ncbi:MAG: hypothetical protein BGO40_02700 [Chryseobacterium sp. 39-10]|nr:T9SS type A sorting domain-containing protein [Chryseobacterium sp.]OJV48438.1 MAG: hypothetical protein BGO40_02700 [Chryseobacterium sp. 39-10]